MKITVRFARFVRRQPLDWWLVMDWYLCATALYRLKLGLAYDTSILSDMHYLPPDALSGDLLRSMLYLHAQPPLMNLLTGLFYKWWPYNVAAPFEIFYLLCGMAAVTLLFHAMRQLGVGMLPRLLVCLLLCSFPTLFLYQAWAYSTHLEFCLSAAAVYSLTVFYTAPERRSEALVGLFASCCLLGLLHAQWNIAVFAGLAALMWVMERKDMRRRIALVSVLCLLPLAAWYTKNLALFGFWGSSSWLGANIGQVAAEVIAPPEMESLKSEGLIAPDFPVTYDIAKILRREPPQSLPPSKIPALRLYKYGDWPNWNYPGVLLSSQQDGRDAITILSRNKQRFLITAWHKMWNLFRRPSCAYPYIPGMDQLLHHTGKNVPSGEGYTLLPRNARDIIQNGAFVLYACVPLGLLLLALIGRPKGSCVSAGGQRKFIFCGFYLMAAMLAISCLLVAFEQDRLRWGMAPFYLVFAAMLLDVVVNLPARLRR